jgi:hypothetical protein
MLQRLCDKKLFDESATDEHVGTLYRAWQLPMYNLDLHEIKVTMDQLNEERETLSPYDY